MSYRVFISHGWHDRWVAKQLARAVREDARAEPFIDIFDLKKGDRIEERIFEELPKCKELVALLTPWSVTRNWVWNEIGAAWIPCESSPFCTASPLFGGDRCRKRRSCMSPPATLFCWTILMTISMNWPSA